MINDTEIKSLLNRAAKGKDIVLMGRIEHLKKIKKIIYLMGFVVWRIWDNDINKQGNAVEGILIEAPNYSKSKQILVIIYSPRYWQDMYLQILTLGYRTEDVYVLDRPSLERNRAMIIHGMNVYEQLRCRYGDDVSVFLVSGPSGDLYHISLFFYDYCHSYSIDNYVVVGDSKGIGNLSLFLGMSPTLRISTYDTVSLGALWKFVGRDSGVRIKPLTIWQGEGDYRFNPCLMRQVERFTLLDTFKHMIFNLPEKTKKRYPMWKFNSARGEMLFKKKKLIRGKTVLLVPYSYTILSLSDKFWQELVNRILSRGYTVCVNIFGKKEKNFIKGTTTLSLDFPSVMDFMEYGATVIGVRSGFFDITSQAKCRRIVLYPKKISSKVTWQTTNMEFCSLCNMGLCEDAYEWEVENEQEIYKMTLSVLENDVV